MGLGLFSAGLFLAVFSPLGLFSASLFPARSFPRCVFSPLGLISYCFFPASVFLVIFSKQGNQPDQIKPSKTKLKPNLNISNLSQPNLA